jgi:hypothetical protein
VWPLLIRYLGVMYFRFWSESAGRVAVPVRDLLQTFGTVRYRVINSELRMADGAPISAP